MTAAQRASSLSSLLSPDTNTLWQHNRLCRRVYRYASAVHSAVPTGKTGGQSALLAPCAGRSCTRYVTLSWEGKNRASRTCQCLETSPDQPYLNVRLLLCDNVVWPITTAVSDGSQGCLPRPFRLDIRKWSRVHRMISFHSHLLLSATLYVYFTVFIWQP